MSKVPFFVIRLLHKWTKSSRTCQKTGVGSTNLLVKELEYKYTANAVIIEL